MDDSQSSDVFSNSGNFIHAEGDSQTYESLILNTKALLSRSSEEVNKATFSTYISSLLDDCASCCIQGLDLVTQVLSESELDVERLYQYLEDAIYLLQSLTNLINNVSVICCKFKTFPTTTGRIIMTVFVHCKDSEFIYGEQITVVEKQLKLLFKACHELQLMYLSILDKYYVFDLEKDEDLNILIEVLDINLDIGEIVQTLDVKTMAEQWKAIIAMVEKYSTCLQNKPVFTKCTTLLCSMVENHMKTSRETEDDKVVLRSLKVASFMLKILMKICNTFKYTTQGNYRRIVELLLSIHLHNPSYLDSVSGMSQQFVKLISTSVLLPSEILLKDLVCNEEFINTVHQLDIIEWRKQDKLLAYILLIISMIKALLLQNAIESEPIQVKLIDCVFNSVSLGHMSFNMGLKFDTKTGSNFKTQGLYEYLLTYTLALISRFDSNEINYLERKMCDTLLSTNSYSAMFSCNLWFLISRISNRQLVFTQITFLIQIYKKLETHKQFADSPQDVHLSSLLAKLFENLNKEDKMRIYKQYDVNESNFKLWSALKISSLPELVRRNAEEFVLEKLDTDIGKLCNSSFVNPEDFLITIKTINLASTCTLQDVPNDIIIKAWLKACPKYAKLHIVKEYHKCSRWFYDYIAALTRCTCANRSIFECSANIVKILHVTTNLIESGPIEIKYILKPLITEISNCQIFDKNQTIVERHLQNALIDLDEVVTTRVLNKEDLMKTFDMTYCHKCIDNKESIIELSCSTVNDKTSSNNFDFADIDTLFEAENDSEPACKKMKLENNEVEEIVCRLENDALLLCDMKENIISCEHKKRISSVCDKLRNILD